MNIQEAREEIIRTIRSYTAKNEDGFYVIPSLRQRPLLLIGPPGIGKTAVMEQAASLCQVGFLSYSMTHHTRQSAIGLPYIEKRNFDGQEYSVTEYTMSEIIASVYRCMEETGCKEGLLFLDEINCVSETLAPAILQFLQNKTFGSQRLPEGWVLAAAGNPSEYNKSVREFDIATLDRLKYIEVEADYEAWRSYALSENMHGAILAYLDIHPENFYVLKQTYASRAFATARGWEDLSFMLKEYESLGFPVGPKLIGQYLQEESLAQDFAGFYDLWQKRSRCLPVPEFLSGQKNARAKCQKLLGEGDFEEQLYLIHLMLSCIDGKLTEWKNTCRQNTRIKDLIDSLIRTQEDKDLLLPSDAMDAFLEKERNIIRVRRENALSSDEELRGMQEALFAMQELGYQLKEAHPASSDAEQLSLSETVLLNQELEIREEAAEEKADEVLAMLSRSVGLLKDSGDFGPAFTFFLASLQQNPLAGDFFKAYPENACAKHWSRLDFTTREEALKELLKK